ncbi:MULTISPECIES: photosystem II assembly protein Psb35 [Leptolyngbya]|jgi:hypothetical protein|uniref:Uncharacterized protein n=2 Tax=Leptolyngbya boryana TaxID=1184 RepID=A0A1Z4JI92_LEPBY|nr:MULTISPECIES: hypothetical protein [Leptolyngbya]BAY56436.1 hypothetical protein NIES2135_32690 [Leptolyngbya boryana NIES-2135]MBD1859791.1 hypothetical protein [Leptolyngbya sp. FACHB-1624]MBD2366539.1 hypothetical protein [Leptolyngbya sp. FACHB-161]MBD2372718.1 hypothetical protein [Leptolyngbya sp. FACHB-238]MBD2397142.1 hypothetical protein [Leptolyngbya sp. FACHB-239]
MNLLLEVATEVATKPGMQFPTSFTLVYGVGFVAAVTIGSIAWYNSKRPVGWEDKERPNIVPEVEKEETPGI